MRKSVVSTFAALRPSLAAAAIAARKPAAGITDLPKTSCSAIHGEPATSTSASYTGIAVSPRLPAREDAAAFGRAAAPDIQ